MISLTMPLQMDSDTLIRYTAFLEEYTRKDERDKVPASSPNRGALTHSVFRKEENEASSTIRFHKLESSSKLNLGFDNSSWPEEITVTVSAERKVGKEQVYHEGNHFYAVAADPSNFGGGYRKEGNSMEARFFLECPDLSSLDFFAQGQIHPAAIQDPSDPSKATPTPYIFESVMRSCGIEDKEEKGRPIRDASFLKPSQTLNLLWIGSIDCKLLKPYGEYRLADLEYLFKSLYTAYVGAKEVAQEKGLGKPVIHTSKWGSETGNNLKVMATLQYLAARKAGVDLVFEGDFETDHEFLNELSLQAVKGWIQSGKFPIEVLMNLYDGLKNFKQNYAPNVD